MFIKFDSDHRMVRSSMQIKKRRRYCRKNSGPRPNQVDKDIFASNLQRSLSQNPNRQEQSVQDTYNLLEQQLVDASKNSIKERPTKTTKLSQITIALIEERDRLRSHKCKLPLNPEVHKEYTELDKRVKREIRRDIREHHKSITQNALENFKSIKKAKKQLNNGKQWSLGVKNLKGERLEASFAAIEH